MKKNEANKKRRVTSTSGSDLEQDYSRREFLSIGGKVIVAGTAIFVGMPIRGHAGEAMDCLVSNSCKETNVCSEPEGNTCSTSNLCEGKNFCMGARANTCSSGQNTCQGENSLNQCSGAEYANTCAEPSSNVCGAPGSGGQNMCNSLSEGVNSCGPTTGVGANCCSGDSDFTNCCAALGNIEANTCRPETQSGSNACDPKTCNTNFPHLQIAKTSY